MRNSNSNNDSAPAAMLVGNIIGHVEILPKKTDYSNDSSALVMAVNKNGNLFFFFFFKTSVLIYIIFFSISGLPLWTLLSSSMVATGRLQAITTSARVAATSDGGAVAVGTYSSSFIRFGHSLLRNVDDANCVPFVIRVARNGTVAWLAQLDVARRACAYARDVTVLAASGGQGERVVVVGSFEGELSTPRGGGGGGGGKTRYKVAAPLDTVNGYAAAFDASSGDAQWLVALQSSRDALLSAVAATGDDGAALALLGTVKTNASFVTGNTTSGAGPLASVRLGSVVNVTSRAVALGVLAGNGTSLAWAALAAGNSDAVPCDVAHRVSSDGAGNLYVSGCVSDALNFTSAALDDDDDYYGGGGGGERAYGAHRRAPNRTVSVEPPYTSTYVASYSASSGQCAWAVAAQTRNLASFMPGLTTFSTRGNTTNIVILTQFIMGDVSLGDDVLYPFSASPRTAVCLARGGIYVIALHSESGKVISASYPISGPSFATRLLPLENDANDDNDDVYGAAANGDEAGSGSALGDQWPQEYLLVGSFGTGSRIAPSAPYVQGAVILFYFILFYLFLLFIIYFFIFEYFFLV